MNLGIDFGSTYTTMTTYDEENEALRDILLSEGTSPFIPSVVTLKRDTVNDFEFGEVAREQIGKKNYRPFKAFKMLLPMDDQNFLKARGYDTEYTPELITEKFLDFCVQEAMERTGNEAVDNIVVGVPECWSERISTMDGRSILRRICGKYTQDNKIQIVSEPAAASAFFAYNYKKQHGKNYDGHILLIDYGGGTLDITLTAVRSISDGSMEIEIVERTGVGENEKNEIGTAGIVFMETLIRKAIVNAEICEEEEIVRDGKFFRAVNELERILKASRKKVQKTFDYFDSDLDHLDEAMEAEGEDSEFTTIEYKGEDLEISFGMLVDVYREVIEPALSEQLQLMLHSMEQQNILPRTNGNIVWTEEMTDHFRIALVGGFGNFDLVERQIKKELNLGALDCTIDDAAEREKSVSMGAALLAAHVISLKNTARYSIGFLTRENEKAKFYYGIRYKQEIVFNQPYFPINAMDGSPVRFMIGQIPEAFIIRASEGNSPAIVAQMRKHHVHALREKIEEIIKLTKQEIPLACMGFSMDSSGIVSIHVRPIDMTGNQIAEDHVVALSSYKHMFELSEIKEVNEGEVYSG